MKLTRLISLLFACGIATVLVSAGDMAEKHRVDTIETVPYHSVQGSLNVEGTIRKHIAFGQMFVGSIASESPNGDGSYSHVITLVFK